MDHMSDLFRITLDFKQSHLFFPHIIDGLLLILLAVMAGTRGPALVRRLRERGASLLSFPPGFDRMRFLGTIIITAVYFEVMDLLSDVFPNTGYSFLITSIIFMATLSLLYVRILDRRKLILIAACSVLAPLVTWYAFGDVFNLTLP